MTRPSLIFILWLSCTPGLHAQHGEPVYADAQLRPAYRLDSADALDWRRARENPVWVAAMHDGHNRLEVAANLEKGAFVPAQGATQVKTYRFDTEGKATRGGVHLYGRFAYARTFEDSTRLRHQTRINPTAPVYFGSLRYNHYERSVYTLGVAAQRDMRGGNLPLTVALDYRVGEHFSNNDPRGGINDFQLDLKAGLGYRAGRWTMHASGRYGYGRERVQVAYKNEKYAGNVEDPLYVNWYMNGYGNAVQRISTPQRRYDDGFLRFGAGGHVLYAQRAEVNWMADINWLREDQRFKLLDNSQQTYSLLNDYTLDRWTATVAWRRKRDAGHSLVADFRLAVMRGRDKEPVLKAVNYTYDSEAATVRVVARANRWQYGASAGYEQVQQQDGVVGVDSHVEAWQLDVQGGHIFPLASGGHFRMALRGGYRIPMASRLIFPALGGNIFATHIVHHDYRYRAARVAHVGVGAAYMIPSKQGRVWELGASADYWRRGGLSTALPAGPSAPGKAASNSKLHLSFFF